MVQLIEKIYCSLGPCLSSDLQKELILSGKSPVAARQSISRFKQARPIQIAFPHNAKFICSQADFGSERYLTALKDAIFRVENGCYALALRALDARGGVIPEQHFQIACGSPLAQSKHPSINVVITRLVEAGIIEKFESNLLGSCLRLKGCNTDAVEDRAYARISAEKILIDCIHEWIRNLNMVSYNSVALRNAVRLPKVGSFYWDIAGPSYLHPLRTGNQPTDCGFVACDVLLEKTMTVHDISPFINKVKTLSSLKRIGKCLYIFVAEGYEPGAFQNLKQMGIVPATVENLFGFELANAMKNLCEILGSVVSSSDNKEKIKNAFTQIGRIEGAALNLRGALFPFLVAEVLKADSYEILKMNKKIDIPDSHQKQEIDIIAKKSNEIFFFECKGEKPESQADDAEIERWLQSVANAKKYAERYPEYDNKRFHYELWTSGFFSNEAHGKIATRKNNITKYHVDCKCGREILQLAKDLNVSHVVETLNEHFFNTLWRNQINRTVSVTSSK